MEVVNSPAAGCLSIHRTTCVAGMGRINSEITLVSRMITPQNPGAREAHHAWEVRVRPRRKQRTFAEWTRPDCFFPLVPWSGRSAGSLALLLPWSVRAAL